MRKACVGGIVALFLVLAAAVAPAPVRAQAKNVTISEALDMYERGDRVVLTGFERPGNGPGLFADLRRVGPTWAKALGPKERPRRLLVMATFALELAHGSSSVIEWACDQIRPPYGPRKPLPEEILWHKVVLANFQGSGNYRVLMTHLWHVARRYKDQPDIQLAKAWMAEAESEAKSREVGFGGAMSNYIGLIGPHPGTSRWDVPTSTAPISSLPSSPLIRTALTMGRPLPALTAPPSADGSASVWTRPTVKASIERSVWNEYTRAAKIPEIAAEAELRMGYLRMVSGQLDQALPHLSKARLIARDRDQQYLADLITAWTEERANHADKAEAAYRRALALLPSGTTAATWLATTLQSQGKLEEAQAVIDATLSATGSPRDPWPQFGQGEYRHAPDLMQQLREAIWAGKGSR